MSLKSIVVVASGETEDISVLNAAAKLAARFGALVRVVPAFPDPAADLIYYGASLRRSQRSDVVERVAAAERDAQDRLGVLVREVADREGLSQHAHDAGPSIILELRELQPAIALAPAAVLADLVLFGAQAATSLGGLFAETLLATRAPCLLVGETPTLFGSVALAWDGSAQAGRAVRAALPLLQCAPKVVVVRNVDDASDASAPADSALFERMQDYLMRHEVANVSQREVRGDNVATSILTAAREADCAMVVAGAYGRPRLLEMVLGGTTRALVGAAGGVHTVLAH